jgi:hypothetical protein
VLATQKQVIAAEDRRDTRAKRRNSARFVDRARTVQDATRPVAELFIPLELQTPNQASATRFAKIEKHEVTKKDEVPCVQSPVKGFDREMVLGQDFGR